MEKAIEKENKQSNTENASGCGLKESQNTMGEGKAEPVFLKDLANTRKVLDPLINYPASAQNKLTHDLFVSFKLIGLDLFWGIPMTAVGMLIVAIRQFVPFHTWCELMKNESESEKAISLPRYTLFMEIIWNFFLFFIPLMTCIVVMEDLEEENTIVGMLTTLYKRWKKLVKISALFGLTDGLYRVVMFFLFVRPFGNYSPSPYPTWMLLPLHTLWVVTMLYVVRLACNAWTTKHSVHLVTHYKLPQHSVYEQARKVEKALRRVIIACLLLATLASVVFQMLLLNVFRVGEESSRTALVTITITVMYPIWLWMDKKGRTSLPWTPEVKHIMKSSQRNNTQEVGAQPSQWSDPIERNGYMFSTLLITAVTIIVRILQANMETLQSKILTGVLASFLESFFVIVRPHVKKRTKKAIKQLKSTTRSLKVAMTGKFAIKPVQIEAHSNQINDIDEKVYRWHRAHMIIIINRLEMFSIMFGNALVLLAVKAKHRAQEKYPTNEEDQCESQDIQSVSDILIGGIILCAVEYIVEALTYMYIIRVEKLPLEHIVSSRRMLLTILIFAVIVIMIFVDQLITVVYVVLSCNKLDEDMFLYHCT